MNVDEILRPSLFDHLHPEHGKIGIGYDVATTEKGKSNPSALALTQQIGLDYIVRALLRWKTDNPKIAERIILFFVTALPHGLRPRRLCIDATSERYFASNLKSDLAGKVPVELVISSESTEYLGEKMTMKSYLGNLLVNTIEDGQLSIPPEDWLKTDLRQVVRARGTFESEVAEDGGHADCFDAIKLSLHALISAGGTAEASATPVSQVAGGYRVRGGIKNPLLKRKSNKQRNLA